ncbi:MAG: hypothetical protein L6E13_09590 [Firmicutes bacterium]|nr:hypothetical protein [Bacillota bacterium]
MTISRDHLPAPERIPGGRKERRGDAPPDARPGRYLSLRVVALLIAAGAVLLLPTEGVLPLLLRGRLSETPEYFMHQYAVVGPPASPWLLVLLITAAVLAAILLSWPARRARGLGWQQILSAPFLLLAMVPLPLASRLLFSGPHEGERLLSALWSLLMYGWPTALLAQGLYLSATGEEIRDIEWLDGPGTPAAARRLRLGRSLAGLGWYLPMLVWVALWANYIPPGPPVMLLLSAPLHLDYPTAWSAARVLLLVLLLLRLAVDLVAWALAGRPTSPPGEGGPPPVAGEIAHPGGPWGRAPWVHLALGLALLVYGCAPFVAGAASLPAGAWPETQELAGSAASGWITGTAAGLALAMALPPGLLLGVLLGVLRDGPAGRTLNALLAPWVYGMGAAGPLVMPLVLLAPALALGLPPRNLLPLAATMAVGAIPLVLLLTAQGVATWVGHRRRTPAGPGWGSGHLSLYLLGGLTVIAAHLLAAEMALATLKLSPWDPSSGEYPAGYPSHPAVAWHVAGAVAGLALVGHGLRRWAWNLRTAG